MMRAARPNPTCVALASIFGRAVSHHDAEAAIAPDVYLRSSRTPGPARHAWN